MKLIDKDALVAKIEKLINEIYAGRPFDSLSSRQQTALWYIKSIMSSVNTLEVKEVDLEDVKKEELAQKYIDYTFRRHNIDPESKEGQLIYYAYMHGMNQCLTQLRTQKGE